MGNYPAAEEEVQSYPVNASATANTSNTQPAYVAPEAAPPTSEVTETKDESITQSTMPDAGGTPTEESQSQTVPLKPPATSTADNTFAERRARHITPEQRRRRKQKQQQKSNSTKNASNTTKNETGDTPLDESGDGDLKEDTVEEDQTKLEEAAVRQERMWISAIAGDPKSSQVRTQFANYLFAQNRFDEAAFQFETALRFDPNNIVAHYDMAFMRHHQFYLSFGSMNLSAAETNSTLAVKHYHNVLRLEENDVETHYQLALLYLTQLETCLPRSLDDISSPLAVTAAQCLANPGARLVGIDTRMGRGRYSPWYEDRTELFDLCQSHIDITLQYVTEYDPVAFGTHITYARLLYLQCVHPFSFSFSADQHRGKLEKGIYELESALDMNEMDATLHHDIALLLGTDVVQRYEDSSYHWKISVQLDPNNFLYPSQLGALYQYKLGDADAAAYYYEQALKLKPNHAQVWNNLGILRAQNAKTREDIRFAAECWKRTLEINSNHPEAHQNLGNILWLHFSDTHTAEIHLQRAISIFKQVFEKLDELIDDEKLEEDKIDAAREAEEKKKGIEITPSNITHYLKYAKVEQIRNDRRYNEMMKLKFRKLLSQCKSDYGGLLLMMFQYSKEAERELKSALTYDNTCVSAHYYYGKHLMEQAQNFKLAAYHLETYLQREMLRNNVNKAHAHQLLGDIYRYTKDWSRAEQHFRNAVALIDVNVTRALQQSKKKKEEQLRTDAAPSPVVSGPSTTDDNDEEIEAEVIENLPLPVWALVKMHAGLGDAVVYSRIERHESDRKKQLLIENRIRRHKRGKQRHNTESDDNVAQPRGTRLDESNTDIAPTQHNGHLRRDGILPMDEAMKERIEMAKKHYRTALTFSRHNTRSHLGLAIIHSRFTNRPRRAEFHYQKTIALCDKLVSVYKKQRQAKERKMRDERDGNDDSLSMGDSEEQKTMSADMVNKGTQVESQSEIESKEEPTTADQNSDNQQSWLTIELTVQNITTLIDEGDELELMKECLENKIEAHLGFVQLLLSAFQRKRWKEALSHCKDVLKIDTNSHRAYMQMAIVLWRLQHNQRALNTAQQCLELAKENDRMRSVNSGTNSENAESGNKGKKKVESLTNEMEVEDALSMILAPSQ